MPTADGALSRVIRWRRCSSHIVASLCGSIVAVAACSGLEAALARTGGTLTMFLEQLVGEPIDVHDRHHEKTASGATSNLGIGPRRHLLKRSVVLRGRRSERAYVYAESLIVPGRLPDTFVRRLEISEDPIGRILTEERIAFSRVQLPRPRQTAPIHPRCCSVGSRWIPTNPGLPC